MMIWIRRGRSRPPGCSPRMPPLSTGCSPRSKPGVRGRYPRSAPDSLAADGVESRIEDDDPKHDDTKQALIDAKLALSNRLGEDWRDLANALGIPLRYQRRFESGREAEGIWEWLEIRRIA